MNECKSRVWMKLAVFEYSRAVKGVRSNNEVYGCGKIVLYRKHDKNGKEMQRLLMRRNRKAGKPRS